MDTRKFGTYAAAVGSSCFQFCFKNKETKNKRKLFICQKNTMYKVDLSGEKLRV
jgi:hypothetical protein